MSKKNKKSRLHKTLVEQILDKNKIAYEQLSFATHEEGDVAQMDIDESTLDQHTIYKTLVASGKETGPVVGVLPIDTHLDLKKLAKVSGNKKVSMVPLKELVKTTGYEHGANTPIGIWEKLKYPIYFDNTAKEQGELIVSSGQIGRSVKVNAEDLCKLVHGEFVDLLEV
ncbi:aminoacyl-tRNA deacylase [Secundilactobacillus paracollinoides]|uniref:Cys-tRNA(Pro)/Cys-tRNA(Cys) deacylase n=1 Tax=Secundilactobacillus paracollinoides TaxID=240427 RepID=A0A1B2IW98_9LACO|nr:aminoacyl-tRNA deacylase [Secundilactobacillus paracollinoides]ANZ60498.1 aminoacyl-tRNA deacylase [Secundilactobacillus paracollinoides]ANZ64810.1 aminoacyl-tRNA deacylase [Secundilactobacillus paracollinoides]ANZ66325.1 aminoacyl-tRNA deacylase [Secundilactobacillus paracollinoides]KRL81639.1 transcription regulator [Secundilactobacillus paracollinoides DSM 15502 = JCM 11969]